MKTSTGAEIFLKGLKQFEEGAKTLGDVLKGGKLAKEYEEMPNAYFKGGAAGKATAQTEARMGSVKDAASILETPTEVKMAPAEYFTKLVRNLAENPNDTAAQQAFAFAAPKLMNWQGLSRQVSNFKIDLGKEDVETMNVPYSLFGKLNWDKLRSKNEEERKAEVATSIPVITKEIDRLYADRPNYQRELIAVTASAMLDNWAVYSRNATDLEDLETIFKTDLGQPSIFGVDIVRRSPEVDRATSKEEATSRKFKSTDAAKVYQKIFPIVTNEGGKTPPAKAGTATGQTTETSNQPPTELPANIVEGKSSIFKKKAKE